MERSRGLYVFSEWAAALNVRWGADPRKLEVVRRGSPTRAAVEDAEAETFRSCSSGATSSARADSTWSRHSTACSGDNPTVRLILAGSIPDERNPDRSLPRLGRAAAPRSVLARLGELERTGVVEVRGAVAADVADSLYAAADAFVMPAGGRLRFHERRGDVACPSGRLLGSGPIAETISHGETGLLVRPGDVDGLGDAMARLAADPGGRADGRGGTRRPSFSLHDRRVQGATRRLLPAGEGG